MVTGINVFDKTVMEWVQAHLHAGWSDPIFIFLSLLGEAAVVWLVPALVLCGCKRQRTGGMMVICAVALAFLVGNVVLKNMVMRVRPYVQFPDFTQLLIPEPGAYSFPSSHSATSFAAAAVFACVYPKLRVWAYLLAGLIALSRVVLFVHYPTDVLAGAALGICMGYVAMYGFQRIYRHFKSGEHAE